MAGLLDLPPELLIGIFEELGSGLKVYTDKERQHDLTRVSSVHSVLCQAARSLLYGGSVNIRSAGRTFLLSQTLSINNDLTALVQTLVAKSENDAGHTLSLISILNHTPNLSALTLSAVFFKDPPTDLYTALQAHTGLRTFSYGYRGFETPFENIVPLLPSFKHLKHLALDRICAIPPGRHPNSLLTRRDIRKWGPPPSYRLESFRMQNCRSIDTPGWPLNALRWALGATDALRSLALVSFDGAASLQDFFALLAERGCTSSLEHLTISVYRDSLSPDPTPFDPNSFAALFPALTHLSLMTNDDESSFSTPSPYLLLPSKLRILEMHDDLFHTWRLLEAIETGGVPPSLRKIKLKGPFPTDPDVRALKWACQDRGVAFEVERAF
ncbi:hypothetical protein JCM21900_000495 [Sporobolomyces salmonicolor]